jgi:hypothetical protein
MALRCWFYAKGMGESPYIHTYIDILIKNKRREWANQIEREYCLCLSDVSSFVGDMHKSQHCPELYIAEISSIIKKWRNKSAPRPIISIYACGQERACNITIFVVDLVPSARRWEIEQANTQHDYWAWRYILFPSHVCVVLTLLLKYYADKDVGTYSHVHLYIYIYYIPTFHCVNLCPANHLKCESIGGESARELNFKVW